MAGLYTPDPYGRPPTDGPDVYARTPGAPVTGGGINYGALAGMAGYASPYPEEAAPPRGPDILVNPSTQQWKVNDFVFDADDDASALESEALLSQPGRGDTPPGWQRVDPQAYGEYLRQIKDPTLGRLAKRNFGRGVDIQQQLLGRGLQLAGAEQFGGKLVAQQNEDLRKTSPYDRQFTDIGSADNQGPIDWLVANFAQQGPNLIESVATGLTGYGLGAAYGGTAVSQAGQALAHMSASTAWKQGVTAALEKKLAGQALDAAETKLLREAAGLTGAVAASFAQNTATGAADIYGETRDAGAGPNDNEARMKALAGSIPYGLLETLPEYVLASRVLNPGNLKRATTGMTLGAKAGEYARRFGVGLAVGGTAEGTTEAGQEGLLLGANEQVDWDSPQGINRLVNSFAAGFGIGGPIGGVANLRSGKPVNIANPNDTSDPMGPPKPRGPEDQTYPIGPPAPTQREFPFDPVEAPMGPPRPGEGDEQAYPFVGPTQPGPQQQDLGFGAQAPYQQNLFGTPSEMTGPPAPGPQDTQQYPFVGPPAGGQQDMFPTGDMGPPRPGPNDTQQYPFVGPLRPSRRPVDEQRDQVMGPPQPPVGPPAPTAADQQAYPFIGPTQPVPFQGPEHPGGMSYQDVAANPDQVVTIYRGNLSGKGRWTTDAREAAKHGRVETVRIAGEDLLTHAQPLPTDPTAFIFKQHPNSLKLPRLPAAGARTLQRGVEPTPVATPPAEEVKTAPKQETLKAKKKTTPAGARGLKRQDEQRTKAATEQADRQKVKDEAKRGLTGNELAREELYQRYMAEELTSEQYLAELKKIEDSAQAVKPGKEKLKARTRAKPKEESNAFQERGTEKVSTREQAGTGAAVGAGVSTAGKAARTLKRGRASKKEAADTAPAAGQESTVQKDVAPEKRKADVLAPLQKELERLDRAAEVTKREAAVLAQHVVDSGLLPADQASALEEYVDRDDTNGDDIVGYLRPLLRERRSSAAEAAAKDQPSFDSQMEMARTLREHKEATTVPKSEAAAVSSVAAAQESAATPSKVEAGPVTIRLKLDDGRDFVVKDAVKFRDKVDKDIDKFEALLRCLRG